MSDMENKVQETTEVESYETPSIVYEKDLKTGELKDSGKRKIIKMAQIEGQREDEVVIKKSKKINSPEHAIKIALNQLVRDAGKAGIPILTIYFSLEDNGYVFNGILPEELGLEELKPQYGRFDDFLRICMGFNKEDAIKAVKTIQ